ncbi:efflux RND transporter periplasmic adaptor subunit [Aliikangiella marina]|uniref:Efflux RND transporter periplasmic adaptor subunit n=1 Tax=Aliikangiella marina TaxID=1712262 RepID=A0A545T9Q7_9GAMM|nr:efflux RND transporter periplasmic adaptor subunit [Aliikangiella marina]TQV73938.1 efflux RND transporter periplasmic adaptor subunit [Aliikangiella marina]
MKLINNHLQLIIGLILGGIISAVFVLTFHRPGSDHSSQASDEKKPLYWVAPMDSNYRRDKPGKSPMGMDLVPVYAEDSASSNAGVGAVMIAPEVINNLGVRTAKVERKALETVIKTVGFVQYDEEKLVHIHPRVEGWIEKLFVKAVGDTVEKDQPLYEIYSPALVNAQEEFILALSRKNSLLVRAAEERLKALQISERVIRQLRQSRQVSQSITFYAPQSGVIDNLNIRQGFYVKPGTTLMSIGALEQVWVEAEIFERQVPFVKVGMPVTMTLDYLPGEMWQGQVDYIYPTLETSTRTVKVRLKFANRDDLLKPNMFAQVNIDAKTDSPLLTVPRESVIRTGKQDRLVLALEDGRFKSIEVKLGQQDGSDFEIIEGVEEGDTIVTSAQFLIDSESSKSSDFKRMQSLQDETSSVWTSATIHSLTPEQRLVNASHDAISEWQWPEMTMDFSVSESVDFSQLKAGLSLHIEITRSDDSSYQISDIHIMAHTESNEDEKPASAKVDGVINSIDIKNRVLNISRGPIKKWDRPAATMNFLASDEIDLTNIQEAASIRFTFEIRDGEFVIVAIDESNHAANPPAKH